MHNIEHPKKHLNRAPQLQRAREASIKAHAVVIKLKEMGLPAHLDNELSQLCTDLGDLWGAQKTLGEQLESFIESGDGWSGIGDHLVDLRACIDHISWHLQNVRRPMTKITRYAYSQQQTF